MTDTKLDEALKLIDQKNAAAAARNRCHVILADTIGIPEDVAKLLSESETVRSALDWSTTTPEAAKAWVVEKYPTLIPSAAEKPKADPKLDALVLQAANGSKTAEGALFVAVGKDKTKMDELIAAKRAEAGEDKGHQGNPWHIRHCDRDGRYTAAALTQQSRLVKSVGIVKATAIAAAYHGARPGDTMAPAVTRSRAA